MDNLEQGLQEILASPIAPATLQFWSKLHHWLTEYEAEVVALACWNGRYFDFTGDEWQALSPAEQLASATACQHWYAKNLLGLEQPEKTIPAGGASLEMMLIPPGKFWMGDQHHKVLLTQPFWLGKYEVTQEQWQAVMGNNPSYFTNAGNHAPVERVSWHDCQSFCSKTGLKLPTEAQWEYACRSGVMASFYWGDRFDLSKINSASYWAKQELFEYKQWKAFGFADKCQELKARPLPVGSFPANGFGLYDMLGNVLEWCNDWYRSYPNEEISDPKGPLPTGSRRVSRGGSWFDLARSCRCARRGCGSPAVRYDDLGLRVLSPKI